MRKFVFLLIFLRSFLVGAQIDTEFWFAAPEVSSQHADAPVYLHLTSFSQSAGITISIPSNPGISDIVINLEANQSISVRLDQDFAQLSDFENFTPNVVANKGIHVKSTQSVAAYYEVRGTDPSWGVSNTDIFTLKGKNSLGRLFFTPFQKGLGNYDLYPNEPYCWSSIDIVAVEDNTQVTITPTVDVFGSNAGVPIVIQLDKGQTYSIRGLSQDELYSMSGTKIESDRDIAVTVKDDSVIQPTGGSWDLVGDQLIPVDVLGIEYLASFGQTIVVATEDDTQIEINSSELSLSINLSQGETYQFENELTSSWSEDQVALITSDKPVYVFNLKSIGTEYSGGVVPSIDCTGSKKVSVNRATDETLLVELFFKTGTENDFLLNDNDLGIDNMEVIGVIPSTSGEWSYARLNIPSSLVPVNSVFTIENTKGVFHLGVLNGSFVTGAQYGFFSNFGNLELGADQTLCDGDELILDAGFGRDSYSWSTGETMQFITVDTSGQYIVTIVEGTCQATDTIDVVFNPSISVDLGDDTFVCQFDSIVVNAPNYADSVVWGSGSTDFEYLVTETDSVILTVFNEFKCEDSDTIVYSQILLPRTGLSEKIYVCQGDSYSVAYQNESDVYKWYEEEVLIDSSNQIVISQEGQYQVSISNVCGVDSTSFELEFWDIEIPNVLTPNGDGKNDVFVISGRDGKDWDVSIFNRWGKLVYRNEHYDNNWIPDVESGTYYYFVDHTDECNEFKGWIQVIR